MAPVHGITRANRHDSAGHDRAGHDRANRAAEMERSADPPATEQRFASHKGPPGGEVRKPSSVYGDHSSRPVVAGGLEQPTRSHRAGNATPVWSCFGWGLPCPPRHRSGGALLPHRFTLTCLATGGLLSVALSCESPRLAVNQ